MRGQSAPPTDLFLALPENYPFMADEDNDMSELADEVNEMAQQYRNGPRNTDTYIINPVTKIGIYLLTVLPLVSLSYLVYAHRYTAWTYPVQYEPYTSIALIIVGLVITIGLYRFFDDDDEQAYVPGPGEDLDL